MLSARHIRSLTSAHTIPAALRRNCYKHVSRHRLSRSRSSTANHNDRKRKRVFITGASRGIGLEFCKQLLLTQEYDIIASCRHPLEAHGLHALKQATESPNTLQIEKLDVTSDADMEQIANKLGQNENENENAVQAAAQAMQPIDLLILNAGMISGDRDSDVDSLPNLTRHHLWSVINANCISHFMIAQTLFENVKRSERKQIIAISSLMGSISDNGSGNRVGYRVSKCAINCTFQEFKHKGQEFGIHTLILHPGHVQTELGGVHAKTSVENSVRGMLSVIDNQSDYDSGGFYDFTGKQLQW